MTILHACVFVSYEGIHDLVEAWEKKSGKMLVVEHPADGKTKRVHCHVLIETDLADDNPYREAGKKAMGEFFKRGNYWIATRVQKGEHAGKTLTISETMVYMLKGKFCAKFSKNISEEEMETSRANWVDSVKNDNPGEGTERVINSVIDKVKKDFTYHVMDEGDDLECEYNERALLTIVRNETFKQLYYQRRMFPHASHYKIVAGTAFMRLAEHYKCFDKALKLISEKWL